VSLVQGTHIEVAGELGSRFFYLESPRDGRAVFVMPRDGRIIVGTTETRFSADPDTVHALQSEESYLLGVLRHYFPQFADAQSAQLLTSWAGLRVLPGGSGHAFHKSRETILHTDRADKPRCLSVYGGKLTTYRTTALKVMDKIRPSLPDRRPQARTDELPLRPVD
jgi:glycerol-3-phosphate dehydrogenase